MRGPCACPREDAIRFLERSNESCGEEDGTRLPRPPFPTPCPYKLLHAFITPFDRQNSSGYPLRFHHSSSATILTNVYRM